MCVIELSHKPNWLASNIGEGHSILNRYLSFCLFLYNNQHHSGLFNVGTGKAETFKALVENTFEALNMECQINYIDTPEDIRDKYQYFTEADMSKLKSIGYHEPFFSLKEGVQDYIQHYLNR